MSKEQLGGSRKCDGCGKVGKERLTSGIKPTKWVCSEPCAKQFISQGNWGVLAWLKV